MSRRGLTSYSTLKSPVSLQVRLGQIVSGTTQDPVLLLEQSVPATKPLKLGELLADLAGPGTVFEARLAHQLRQAPPRDSNVARDRRALQTGFMGEAHNVVTELLG